MAIDWTRGMEQEFLYYRVDPATWTDAERIEGVVRCSVDRDLSTDVLESAELEIDSFDGGECWIRCYADFAQDGERYRSAVGTWLAQTPRRRLDGKTDTTEVRCYGSLHPLKEALCAAYAAPKGTDAVAECARLLRAHGVAPVEAPESGAKLSEHYVAPFGTPWLDVCRALAEAGGCELGVDGYGRVYVQPARTPLSRSVSWTFRDGQASVVSPGMTSERDWYGLPNVCIVKAGRFVGRAANTSPYSPISTTSRGREVVLAVEDPDELKSGASQAAADAVARKLLAEASTVERKVTFSHGYVPVALGDRVRLEVEGFAADVRVSSQRLELGTGAAVEAEGTWTDDLYERGDA